MGEIVEAVLAQPNVKGGTAAPLTVAEPSGASHSSMSQPAARGRTNPNDDGSPVLVNSASSRLP
jgi:hypothetical protein